MEGLVVILRKMAVEEKRYAEELEDLSRKFRHPLLQSLIKGVALDSIKHSVFYEALANMLSVESPVITEEEYTIIREGIEKHIEVESQMLAITGKLVEQVDDPRFRLVLKAIHDDEIRHHKLLVDLKDKIASKEKYGEEELWEAVWKDSPWHGAPGG